METTPTAQITSAVRAQISTSAQKAKSAREHRLSVLRLKFADKARRPRLNKRRKLNHDQPASAAAAYATTGGASSSASPSQVEPMRLRYGWASFCGRREDMEDMVTVAPAFISPDHDFFAVYNGHGGCEVAKACASRLHYLLRYEMQTTWAGGGHLSWDDVVEAGFLRMDEEVGGKEIGEKGITVGSTAVVAIVGTRCVMIGNCGDSRAVLSRNKTAIQLTNDHKPSNPNERKRIEAIGGKAICWDGMHVLGVLATSRSIGDHYLKPYVISKPEVNIVERTNEVEFLILASDGLWDVVSNEIACRIVWRCLLNGSSKKKINKNFGPDMATSMLVEFAIARGSCDNISVVVIDLRPTSKLHADENDIENKAID